MTVKVWDNNGTTAPLLCCDVCDAPIDDAKEGAAVFALVPNGSSTRVLHVHKKGCHIQAEAQLGGRQNTGWQELTDHLKWLTANLGL
jgi:hypothetical protein